MKEILRRISKSLLQKMLPGDTFKWRVLPTEICLSFDDGPDPEYTPKILQALAALEIKATFFFIGEKVHKYPELTREVVRQGHAVGGHSFSHKELTQMTMAELAKDLDITKAAFLSICGVATTLFRPPRGRFNFTTLFLAFRAGYRLAHWSVTYSDYRRDGITALRSRHAKRPVVGGDVVLLHDNNPYTVELLQDIAEHARAHGLAFVTLN